MIDFLNENENRDYPFLAGQTGKADGLASVPWSAIVDFGCVMGPGSGFVENTHKVWLSSLTIAGSFCELQFRTDAPGLVGVTLNFTAVSGVTRFQTLLAEQYPDDADGCAVVPLWSGYVTLGKVPASFAQEDEEDGPIVEPATIKNLESGLISRLRVYNLDRVHYTSPCEPAPDPDIPRAIFPVEECVLGDLRVDDGYNCQVTVQGTSLRYTVGVGVGQQQSCSELKLHDDEEPPEGSRFLGGGPGCTEVLRLFGDAQASLEGGYWNVWIEGENGISISEDPDDHAIHVRGDFTGLAGCGVGLTE